MCILPTVQLRLVFAGIEFVYKVDTAAGTHFDSGMEVVLELDDYHVIHDAILSRETKLTVAILARHEVYRYEENEVLAARTSPTCGPLRIKDGTLVRNVYEWEMTEMVNACNRKELVGSIT